MVVGTGARRSFWRHATSHDWCARRGCWGCGTGCRSSTTSQEVYPTWRSRWVPFARPLDRPAGLKGSRAGSTREPTLTVIGARMRHNLHAKGVRGTQADHDHQFCRPRRVADSFRECNPFAAVTWTRGTLRGVVRRKSGFRRVAHGDSRRQAARATRRTLSLCSSAMVRRPTI